MAEKKETIQEQTEPVEEVLTQEEVTSSTTKEEVGESGENFVFIGKKGAMAYVLTVVTQFESGAEKIVIKARGKSISRAVDVAEIVRNRNTAIQLEGINIATEEVVTQEGRPLKVSSIEITLKK